VSAVGPSKSAGSFWELPDHEREAARAIQNPRVWKVVRERPSYVSKRVKGWTDIVVFATLLALLLIYFRPDLLFSATTTTGGDTGAHVYAPWFLKTQLLPKGMLSGWSPDWYSGFPIFHFYFPLVATFQALLGYLIPYEVAFKIGTVLGTFFLPVSVYLMFRLMRFRFPTPIVGATLTIGFLFMDSFTIYGGNIASSLAGEYSFSLSLGLCLVFYGLAYRVATEENARPIAAAVVLALAALSHLIPVIMVILTTPLLAYWGVRTHGARAAVKRLTIVYGAAFALTAFWSIPFLVRLSYTADMSWIPIEGWTNLLPRELWLCIACAVLGGIIAILRGDRRALLLAVPPVAALPIYFLLPQGHVWNGRFVPFWYLGVFLLAAYFAGTILPILARFLWRQRLDATVLALVAAMVFAIGGWTLSEKSETFVDDWIEDNYEGYEGKPEYTTFATLMERLEDLPSGRVFWEPSSELVRFGTPVSLMSIPYWTDQPTMEGIYFESSITTPFHFLTASEVADSPSNPIPGLPYEGFDLERGIDHMELMDVSYYIAYSDTAREAARDSRRLEPIDDVGDLSIFAVDSPGQVLIPEFDPVVLEGTDWTDANVEWFSESDLEVPLVRDGIEEWASTTTASDLPKEPIRNGGRVIEARLDDDEIAFTTEAVGEPHWIKTSYFPNWKVEGAEGPFLASPSMMMVVPTDNEVRLKYRRTWAEWLGLILTVGALTALAIPRSRRWLRSMGNA
jgi:hypothetical protein